MERVDCVVIGAGVIGLAVARQLATSGREVLILEAAGPGSWVWRWRGSWRRPGAR